MNIETSYVMKFSGFDKRVKIVLPEDARIAATFQVFSDNSTRTLWALYSLRGEILIIEIKI